MDLEEAMQTSEVEAVNESGPIAPWWHTALLLAQLFALAVISPGTARLRMDQPHLPLYLASIMSQWLQLSAAIAGVYHRKRFFSDALRGGSGTWQSEIGIGAALYGVITAIYLAVALVLHLGRHSAGFDHKVILAMAPKNIPELLLWLVVSVVVGFCEELVFRGYLLTQVAAWMKGLGASPFLAGSASALFTSVLFGSLHLYEGLGGAILIGVLGLGYSIVALSRGNLRAVIVAHMLQDSIAMVVVMARHAHHA